jgi:hypothetical protein
MGTRHLYWILTSPSSAVYGYECTILSDEEINDSYLIFYLILILSSMSFIPAWLGGFPWTGQILSSKYPQWLALISTSISMV